MPARITCAVTIKSSYNERIDAVEVYIVSAREWVDIYSTCPQIVESHRSQRTIKLKLPI
jgi:hypothetical protein